MQRTHSPSPDAGVTTHFLIRMEAIMLEILVYHHDVLRYSIVGDWSKVRDLQQQGYYVKVRVWNAPYGAKDSR